MSQRLPTPGGDSGTWGDVLNGYLGVSLAADGTMNPGVVGATVISSGAATSGQVLTANGWGTASFTSLSGDNLGLTPTAVKTAAYTAVAGDLVPVDTTSGGVTIGLPVAPTDKSVVAIKHVIQGSTNVVTFNCGGSDVFNKAGGSVTGTLTLSSQGIILQYKATGAIWYVVADDLPLAQTDLRYLGITAAAATGQTGATALASGAATANQVPLATGWGSATWGSLPGASLSLTDVTTNNASASNHGFLPKLPNLNTQSLLGDGTYNFAPYYSTNSQTNSYTAVLTDHGKIVEITGAGGTTFTIPTNASVAFPVGSVISVAQLGAGQITFAAASGATIVCASSHTKTNTQYSAVVLRKQATDNWVLAGDTA